MLRNAIEYWMLDKMKRKKWLWYTIRCRVSCYVRLVCMLVPLKQVFVCA